MFDPYSVLGISRDASDEEIKAYRKLSLQIPSGCEYQQPEQGAGGREI